MSIGRVVGFAGAESSGTGGWGVERLGSNAESPLPSALRFWSGPFVIGQDLLRKLNIGFGALGTDVIQHDRFAEARCFREAYAARNYRLKDLVTEKRLEVR